MKIVSHFKDAILELKKRTMENEMKEGDLVYVSDVSEEHALKMEEKRILLRKCSNGVVGVGIGDENKYKEGRIFNTHYWKYAVPIPKETKKTVTLELTDEQLKKIKELIN